MPKFTRISLVGSEELFRPTRVEAEHEDEATDITAGISPADALSGRVGEREVEAPTPEPEAPVAPEPPPAAAAPPAPVNPPSLQPGPITRPPLHHERMYHRVALTTEQVRTLIDGLQRMKYPHTVHSDQKPSIEEFEELESIRKILLDALD